MENSLNTVESIPVPDINVEEQADKVIKKHAMLATGAGLIPINGLDVAALTAVQVSMVQRLADIYTIPYEHQQIRIIVTSAIASIFSRLASYGVSEFFHPFQSMGNIADELTNAAVSGFFTVASGEIYKAHFAEGLSFDTLDFSQYFSYFKEQIEAGNISPNMFSNVSHGFSYLTK